MQHIACTFCNTDIGAKQFESKLFFAIYDKFPVNPGHLLIISKRHIPDLFSLDEQEFSELRMVLNNVKRLLEQEFGPTGFNVGANCGKAAGQTIPHFHLHIIPRYDHDIGDPRGGIRNIKPPLVPYP